MSSTPKAPIVLGRGLFFNSSFQADQGAPGTLEMAPGARALATFVFDDGYRVLVRRGERHAQDSTVWDMDDKKAPLCYVKLLA